VVQLASMLHRCQQDARDVYKSTELANSGYIKISVEKDGEKLSIEGSAKHVMQSYDQYSKKKAITQAEKNFEKILNCMTD